MARKELTVDVSPLHWVAVWTRSRHERFVRDQLVEKDVEVFLPLMKVPSQRKDRHKTVDVPVFPGYLFAHIPLNDGYAIKTTRGVVQILGSLPGVYTAVPDEQIAYVRTLVESQLPIDPHPYLKVGSVVRVRKGPLKGIEGILIEKRNHWRIVVSVELLGKSISAEVSADQIEAI